MDEPRVREVVRHLVDEERCSALALNARAFEVFDPEARGTGGVDRRKALGIATLPGAELTRERGHVRKLGCALHHGMTCEDLLDQSRARARQPDDEDRVRRACAIAAPRGKELRGEELHRAP